MPDTVLPPSCTVVGMKTNLPKNRAQGRTVQKGGCGSKSKAYVRWIGLQSHTKLWNDDKTASLVLDGLCQLPHRERCKIMIFWDGRGPSTLVPLQLLNKLLISNHTLSPIKCDFNKELLKLCYDWNILGRKFWPSKAVHEGDREREGRARGG